MIYIYKVNGYSFKTKNEESEYFNLKNLIVEGINEEDDEKEIDR